MKKKVVNRRSIVFLSVFLSLVLLLQSVAMAVPIPPAEELTPSDMTFIETPFIEAEETAQRSKFEKHFRMSDGTYVAVAYADPVHEELPDGSWEEIDNTLSLVNGRYETDTETFKASFAANASGNNGLVALESEGYDLSWSVVILKNNPNLEVMATGGNNLQAVAPSLSAAAVENPATTPFALMSESQKIESAVSASKVTYANAFGSGINLEYGIRAYAVKENVILQNADTGFRGYKMQVTALGLEAQKDEYNTITFADSEGNVKFTIEAPYMMDAEDNVSGDITVTVTQTANGYDITYIPNAQWLNTATYPVVIDPQTTSSQSASNLLDTYTYEGDSTSNAVTRQNQDRMYVGNKSVSGTRKKHIGYFQFLNLPILPTGGIYTSATVMLKCPNGTNTSQPFDLHVVTEEWVTNTLTWANKPSYNSTPVYTGATRNTSTQWVAFTGAYNSSLSTLVKGWYTGAQTNYGFMVCYTSASVNVADYNALYTSNCSTTDVRPYIIIAYEGTQEWTLPDGTYYIKNLGNQKYMTVTNNGVSTANVIPQDFVGTLDQMWQITAQVDGYYSLKPVINPNVMLLTDASNTADGTNISVHSGDYGNSMDYQIVPKYVNGNAVPGQYVIRTRVTNNSSMVTASSTNIYQNSPLSGDVQTWIFESAGTHFTIPGSYDVTQGWFGKLPIVYHPTDTIQSISWYSSNNSVATVNSSGTITAVGIGRCTITATNSSGYSDSCDLTVGIAGNELFNYLLSDNLINSTDFKRTDDGFLLITKSLGEILSDSGVSYLLQSGSDTTPINCLQEYADVYIYSVMTTDSCEYGLCKLRKEEQTSNGMIYPCVQISFVSFNENHLMECIINPTSQNKVKLYTDIYDVMEKVEEEDAHSQILYNYFSDSSKDAPYLIVEQYIYLVVSGATNGKISLPQEYFTTITDDPNGRVQQAMDAIINDTSGQVCDGEYIYINNLSALTDYEKRAILISHTGNATFYSFAAEVVFHARALENLLGEIRYNSALRADMSIKRIYYEDYFGYHDETSDLYEEQVYYHGGGY